MIVFTVYKHSLGYLNKEASCRWEEGTFQMKRPVQTVQWYVSLFIRSMGPIHASIGLDTMLFGVSGSWEDIDATSLPVEFEPGPPSEKFTWQINKIIITIASREKAVKHVIQKTFLKVFHFFTCEYMHIIIYSH